MSKRKTGAAEATIQTENEHWNGYALEFLCSIKKSGLFPDLDKAMELYSMILDAFQEYHAEPLKADHKAEAILKDAGMDEAQTLALNVAAYSYLKGSEFDYDLSVGIALLKTRTIAKDPTPWDKGTREGLQDLIRRELAALPATIEALEPKDRVAALCKLLPYTMPRLSNVEPNDTKKSFW